MILVRSALDPGSQNKFVNDELARAPKLSSVDLNFGRLKNRFLYDTSSVQTSSRKFSRVVSSRTVREFSRQDGGLRTGRGCENKF